MEFLIGFLIVLVIGAGAYIAVDRKKRKKKDAENTRKAEEDAARRRAEEEARRKAEEDRKNADPCRDMRDGTNYPSYMTPQECNKHGYFWCTIAKRCMPSSKNVGDCGKPAHLM